MLSRLLRYFSCCSMFRANFSILLITIMADSLRSLARWILSVTLAATRVNTNEMVVPMIIMPICFQKPPLGAFTFTFGGLMILILVISNRY